MKPLKVLNLYAGIGGNRKLWQNVEVTAVELNPKIAKMYQERFPNDEMVISDANSFLLEHFKEYDFIWSSPPCQSHSRTNYFLKAKNVYRYPDMILYQQIIFLQHFAEGLWVVENVQPYYVPLIPAQRIGRHLLWSNFRIDPIAQPKDSIGKMCGKNQKANKKPLVERNAVNSDLGLHVLNCALGTIPPMPLGTLFENNENKIAL